MPSRDFLLTEKVRLYPTRTQEEILWKLSNIARRLYNLALARCKEYYQQYGKYKGYLRMSKELPTLKKSS